MRSFGAAASFVCTAQAAGQQQLLGTTQAPRPHAVRDERGPATRGLHRLHCDICTDPTNKQERCLACLACPLWVTWVINPILQSPTRLPATAEEMTNEQGTALVSAIHQASRLSIRMTSRVFFNEMTVMFPRGTSICRSRSI